MTTALTADDIARHLAERTSRTYSLAEVAEMTGFALRSLELGCRAGTVEHVHTGKARRMTLRQIDLLIAKNTTGQTSTPIPTPADDLEEARAASRKSGARRAPRRAA